MISDGLRADLEATIEKRVDRYIEVSHQPITPNPYFAAASAECLRLYTDGFFLSAVMVTQAVAEGIRKFVVKCNGITLQDKMKGPAIVNLLVEKQIISTACAKAFNQIWNSHRDDVHHMNSEVALIPFPEIAKKNIQNLAAIEREIFALETDGGRIIPTNPKYWDTREDGKMGVFLRLSP
jgi:hypothetical protein